MTDFQDLRELYQETILDHNRRPRNFGALEHANRRAEGHNPLCGDEITLYLDLREGVVDDVRFEGAGCAISTAAASMMTEAIRGKTESEARSMLQSYHALVTEGDEPNDDLGKLAVFSSVREYPARVKCATLAWHTLDAALQNNPASPLVTTE